MTEPLFCEICGEEIKEEKFSHVQSGLCVNCQHLQLLLNGSNPFKNKNWIYVLFPSGLWIFQPKALALANQKRGCRIFTYDDFKKWLRGQNERL